MITTADFSKGTRFLHKGEPYVIVDISVQSPSARGASTLVKVKARNLLNGKLHSETFKAGSKFDVPDLVFNNVQFLYVDGDQAVFMDQTSYEQFQLPMEALGNQGKYLTDELSIKAMYFNNKPVNIDIPQHVSLQVTMVEPGTRGNTASGSVTTKAELENGVEIQVPLNIKEGDRVLVDTTNDTFYQRA